MKDRRPPIVRRMRKKRARRGQAALLLTTTCLTALLALGVGPVLADGGAGGNGGAGGADSIGGPGDDGGGSGGGGGAGQSGGNGNGNVSSNGGSAAIGGVGGSGGAGIDGVQPGHGGGGGGGAHGAVVATPGALGQLTGGAGGSGGGGTAAGGGGGGAGGYGAGVTGSGSFTSSAAIAGGNGGGGGDGSGAVSGANGGGGGSGGIGVAFGANAGGSTLVNTGSIMGGRGGAIGLGGSGVSGLAGPGGAGVVGSNLTVINSGTIIGGRIGAGGGSTQANAITFTGGTNVLELRAGSDITGTVVAFSGADTFRLGGSVDGTFEAFRLGTGAQFENFGVYEKTGMSTWTLTGPGNATAPWTITQGALAISDVSNLGLSSSLTFNGGTLQALGTLTLGIANPITLAAAGGTIDSNGNNVIVSSAISGAGGLTKIGAGELRLAAANTWGGGTIINAGTLVLDSVGGSLPAGGALTVNGGLFDMSEIATGQTVGALAGAGGQIALGANTLTTNSNANTTLATTITGTGALIKQGTGVLTLTGNNLYSGGTTVSGGLINFNALANFGTGTVTLNGGGLQWAAGNSLDISSRLVLGAGGATFDTNGNNVSFGSGLTGTGGITKQGSGILNLAGANTYTGPTAVTAGTLAVNGSITSNVTVGAGGTLVGNGTIFGATTIAGTLAPGNSIGTFTIAGNFTQAAGSTYQVEANAQGQADRINVGGTATVQGGTVQVLAQPGSYGASTTYTILNATGGVSGAYSNVTSNFAFLTPSLAYDANNVFLTLALQQNAFSFGGNTPNQKAVGAALDQSFANASGDFATVLGVMAGLSTAQGPLALDAISGQPWADFGTMNTNNSAMFMNAIGQQMASARGSAASGGQRQALAQACEIEACDATNPLSAWMSALGGLGSVLGDGNASTLTYNFGGAAAGIDYRLDPRFLVGLGVGYSHGTQWVNSFMGQGWSDSVSVAAYGSFTQGGAYVDALAGYAWFNNQLQRQIQIPSLQPRTASGSAGANQFLGQVEAGYKVAVHAPGAATITPFGRLQVLSTTQNAFSESGAQSLSLNVAQQTTNALRTTIGADLAGAIGYGDAKKIDLALRLGWMHEFASTSRPITAAFAGAPSANFTVYGATPQRDAAVIGFQASTNVATATQLYLRYDGEIGSGTDNHALNLGLRLSW